MGLPDGEVRLTEVLAWVQDQADYLPTPGQRLVLWYLCTNAFRTEDNREGRSVGDVLSAFVPVARICRGTGCSERNVRDSLDYLQDAGYIIATHRPGHGKSRISVFWTEAADQMRADARAGRKPLPKEFQRPQKKAVETRLNSGDGVIVEFPYRQNLPQ